MKNIFILLITLLIIGCSNSSLIIPLATTHIGPGHNRVNNENRGLGIEYSGDYTYSATYLAKNSYSERSIYLSASKKYQFKDVSMFAGLTLASGYERISDSGLIIAPIYGVQYKSFRIVTTFPAANLACPTGSNCADFFTLLYTHKF